LLKEGAETKMKTTPATQNGWTAFVQSVKEYCPDSELSKKDYSKMMDWYVTGKSAEKYVKESME